MIGNAVIINQVVPESNAGDLQCFFSYFIIFALGKIDVKVNILHQFVHHIGIVIIGTGDNNGTMIDFGVVSAHPKAKTRKAGGYRWDMKGQAFQGSIAPGFVVGRKDGKVKTDYEIIVLHIEYPVPAIEIAGHEDHLDIIFRHIIEAGVF